MKSLPMSSKVAWICLLFAVSNHVLSQAPNIRSASTMVVGPVLDPAPTLLGQDTTSDATAVSAFEELIDASGGRDVWSSIHDAVLRQRVGDPAGKTAERLYMDDWSLDKARYRRSSIGDGRKPKDHDGRDHYTVKTEYGEKIIPEFDRAHLIAGTLPAGAATVILSSKEYIVRLGTGSRCGRDTRCVNVYLRVGNIFVRRQEWILSNATHLPEKVDLVLPSLLGNSTPVQEFSFQSFETHHKVIVPSLSTVSIASGRPVRMALVRVEFNRGFDKQAFDKEAGSR